MTDWNLQKTTFENLYLSIGEGYFLLIDSQYNFLIEPPAIANTVWVLQAKS